MGNMNRLWAVVAVLATISMVPMLAMAADEDPLQDFCVADNSASLTINGFPCKPAAKVTAEDFIFRGLKSPDNTNNNKNQANVTPATVIQFPGLNTLGLSALRADFAKGDLNPPHTHPRSTELLFLVKGELYVGFVDTNNILWATTLKAGELFVFPRGLVHFQLNVGWSPAMSFSAFNSQNPGRQAVATALFSSTPPINDEVLEKGFRIDDKTVKYIRAQSP